MSFDTGDVGENWVQLWASQAEITANPVRRDKCGWDFCFQVRRKGTHPNAVPLDRLPPEITAMVQVKSSVVGRNAESVALSNWHRMIKDPFPWFFLRVELDAEGDATRAYLVHVGADWIERVQRRLRALGPEAGETLHQRTLDVTWSDGDILAQPIAQSLRAGLLGAVGHLDEYVRNKIHARETVGYAEHRYRVEMRRPVPKTDADIEREVDFAIGLVKTLPIRSFSVSDVRFDVPAVIKYGEDATIELSTLPSVGTTRLRLSNITNTKSILLDCETYLPTILFPRLPSEHIKVRFVSPVAEIVVEPRNEHMHISWSIPDESTPTPLSRFANIARLVDLFVHSRATGGVAVAYESESRFIDLARGGTAEFSTAVKELVSWISHAEFIAQYFGIDTDEAITIADLETEADRLLGMRAALDRPPEGFSVSITIRPGRPCAGERCAIVLPMSVRLGGNVLAATVAVIGPAEWNEADSRMTISSGTIEVLDKSVVRVEDWEAFDHRAKATSVRAPMLEGLAVVAFPGTTR